ncbi:MAG: hypothetical protein ACJ796_04080 [Gemmatimonadaceae bacterium]
MPEDARTPLPGGGRANARFRAVMIAMVPEAAALDTAAWIQAEAIIARALASRPAGVRRQLGVFLLLLDVMAVVRHRRGLISLNPFDRVRLLESLSKSRLVLLRRGMWGIRTLAFMGYYARPGAAGAIGYRASAGGWAARREVTEQA